MKPDLDVTLEWRATPLWVYDEAGAMDNPGSATLVDEPLAGELDRWALDHDAYWDPDDPRGPKFPDRQTELDFYARGRALAERVAAAIGDRWSVRYQDADGAWETLS